MSRIEACARCGRGRRVRDGDRADRVLCRGCHLAEAIDMPDMPDLTAAPCIDRPDEWDLDVIGRDPAAVEHAIRRCRSCPVLQACTDWTRGLQRHRLSRPIGVVQAGQLWGYAGKRGRPSADAQRRTADCEWCGQAFRAIDPRKRFCSRSCASRHNQAPALEAAT